MPDALLTYCLGFVFSEDGARVLLLRKHGGWQHGFHNGVGGKLEGEETPLQAMDREFAEEVAGVQRLTPWRYVILTSGSRGHVHIFASVGQLEGARGRNPLEPATPFYLPGVYVHPFDWLPDLEWMVPMARGVAFGRISMRDGHIIIP